MKKLIKSFAQLIVISCFTTALLTACGAEDDADILDTIPKKEMTDEENEKKSKPGGS